MKRKAAESTYKWHKRTNREFGKASNLVSNNVSNSESIGISFEDYIELAPSIAVQQGYDEDQLIICDTTEISKYLDSDKYSNINEKPIFFICLNKEKNATVAFCIVKLSDKVICLYKDYLGTEIQENIKGIIEHYFGKNIIFKIHNEALKAQDKANNIALSLATVKFMMVHMKTDKRKEFILNFAYQSTIFEQIREAASDIFSFSRKLYHRIIFRDVEQLSRDAEFKRAIQTLINSIPCAETVDNFKQCHMLLDKIAQIEEDEEHNSKVDELYKQYEQLKKDAFRKIDVLKIKTQSEESVTQLEIVKNFPRQMEKFTNIFKPLKNSKIDDKLEETLKYLSSKLDLEYDKLRSFFRDEKKENSVVQNVHNINTRNTEDVTFNDSINGKFQAQDNDWIKNKKTFKELLSEITLENLKDKEILKKKYYEVKKYYKIWCNKNKLEINEWSSIKKGELKDSETYEALAIMDRANELVTRGHTLHDTQILSVLIFLHQKNKGHLSQIKTGEGKTTIVSILAAIKALQGSSVDIITSNSVLASDAVKNKTHFYDLLNLSAVTNNLDEKYKSGARECYKADIVYGSMSSFQFDYLKDSFLGLETRANRPFNCIILDEVDSMLIDNASRISKLSTPFPGMEILKYVYIKIWQELHKAEKEVLEEFQKKIILKKELQKAADYEDIEVLFQQYSVALRKSMDKSIINKIKSSRPTKVDIIPSHLQDYADKSLDKWITSAMHAKYEYHKDEQYVIQSKNGEKTIQPVDYTNTGIILKNTVWQHGLHQFLQLKHNLHLTSENLTSCFISIVAYIKKYHNQIFGLTGTLGSEAEQELISSIYNVGFSRIPAYKESKFIEIDSIVVDDAMFITIVADDVKSKIDDGRAVLIICETINGAKAIEEVLKNKDISLKCFYYEENAHVTEEEVMPGDVIIATNIAGRGTDFKTTSELEGRSGLHVCVTFLPCNKRVEEQAFGRTARQGHHGTAQLILKKSELENSGINSCNSEDIKNIRDEKEKDRIEQIKTSKLPVIEFQDKLFGLFSTLYRKLQIESCLKGVEEKNEYVLRDLKEFWAFWLEKNDYDGSELVNKCPEEEFKNFETEACEIIQGYVYFNPYYSIQQAEYFILNENLNKAEKALKDALEISKNPGLLHSAYFKLFEITMEKGQVFQDKCRKAIGDLFCIKVIEPDRKYKENAKKYLIQAKQSIQKEYDYIKNLFANEEFMNIIRSDNLNDPDSFLKHVVSKKQALKLYMRHVDSLVEQIDKYRGGIYISGRVSNYFSNLKLQNENEKKIKKTITDSEFSELAFIGTSTLYTLREMHDVDQEIVKLARLQIVSGLAVLALGFCFPPALSITSEIGAMMITEGICDIANELISQSSDGKFNKKAYIKSKVITYGVSFVRIGSKAVAPKVLNEAKKACRYISGTLRKSPSLKIVCEALVTKFDKLGNWFKKIEIMAEFNEKSKLEKFNYVDNFQKQHNLTILDYLGDQIKVFENLQKEFQQVGQLTEPTHFEKCLWSLGEVFITTASNVTSRTMQVITATKIFSMTNILTQIKEIVDKTIREDIAYEKLRYYSYEDIKNIICEIKECVDFKTMREIFKEAIFEMLKYCSKWSVQLGALAIHQLVSWKKVFSYAKDLCKTINEKLQYSGPSTNQDIDKVLNLLIEHISEEIYSQVFNNIIKSSKDFHCVLPSALEKYSKEKQEEAERLARIKNFEEGGQAGQEQAKALSDVIQRTICIYEEHGNTVTLGKQYLTEPIKITYFPPNDSNNKGHYVPYGHNRNWYFGDMSRNNCLFDVVGLEIQKDPSTLREKTLQMIKCNPANYIAAYVSDVLGPEIFLEGGRCYVPLLTKNYYPSHNNRIKAAKEHKTIHASFSNELDKYLIIYKSFNKLKESEKIRYLKYNGTIPIFTSSIHEKEEMMMGSLSVSFRIGETLKWITVSGDTPFAVRSNLDENLPFMWKKDGFGFIDYGNRYKEEKRVVDKQVLVYDVYNRIEHKLNIMYKRNCAAQKLLHFLGEEIKIDENLEITEIRMAESWYKPSNTKVKADDIDLRESCYRCEKILPLATGAGFTA